MLPFKIALGTHISKWKPFEHFTGLVSHVLSELELMIMTAWQEWTTDWHTLSALHSHGTLVIALIKRIKPNSPLNTRRLLARTSALSKASLCALPMFTQRLVTKFSSDLAVHKDRCKSLCLPRERDLSMMRARCQASSNH